MITSGEILFAAAGQVLFAIIIGIYIAPIPAMLVEVFPTSVRYTGMALACNISAAVFGGTAPMIETWLVKVTGDPSIIAAYIIVSCLAAAWALRHYAPLVTEDKPL